MMSFTKCDLQFNHKKHINAALLDDETLIVERSGINLPEIYISSPISFIGHWTCTNKIHIENPMTDIMGISGIIYHKVTHD